MLKVLYVDDEPDLREIVSAALELDSGISVRTCRSAAEARAALRGEAADLILLDVMMPEIDGPAFFLELRGEPSTAHIPVMFITARVGSKQLEAYKSIGAVGIIEKPFNVRTLAAVIRAHHDQISGSACPNPSSRLEMLQEELRRKFRLEAAGLAERIEKGLCLHGDDPESAARLIHALAGTAGTLGFHEISAVALEIDANRSGEHAVQISRLCDMLHTIATNNGRDDRHESL
jgi:DNA-binding response OmpR family regulator